MKAVIATVTCCLYPFEVIGSHMATCDVPMSIIQATKYIYEKHGPLGFWNGFGMFAMNLGLSIGLVAVGNFLINQWHLNRPKKLKISDQ